jgi:hypothetical protein
VIDGAGAAIELWEASYAAGTESRVHPRGRSPYPERAAFVDADSPTAGREIRRAADQGLAIVLVSADGTTQTLSPDPVPGR